MEESQRYAIPYKGLKNGCHEFRFEVDGSLFEEYQSTEIKDGRCEVTVAADRSESQVTLDVAIAGYVVVSATAVWKIAACPSISRGGSW